ncbi:hypothetical protein [Streptomyces sp. NBC_01190]|uniref:hypothetical protein n=1 Tax=Streptomyces sp. NBC_01190 TaxID=2903767 RepID=UPI003862FADC|nr:hypothetical protein OG519_33610 [Streptomyces sp. NBC_01190]
MRIRFSLIATTACAALVAALASGCSAAKGPTPDGTWTPAGRTTVSSLTGAEGIASTADGALVHRGPGSIPLAVRGQGFQHVGDLDIARGSTFDAYERKGSGKMFLVTTAGGKRLEFRHALDRGELFNNSFVTVSPDGQWIVAGEFGAQKRLQVFPAPLLNTSTSPGANLPQAGQVTLDHVVDNIQGCDFFSAQRLLCTADQGDLLRLDLPHTLDGRKIDAAVTDLFTLPKVSKCSGAYEAEGIDYDTKTDTLRAGMLSPGLCKGSTVVFSFTWKAT